MAITLAVPDTYGYVITKKEKKNPPFVSTNKQ